MSFNKKTWATDGDLTEKEMNDLEDRTEKAIKELDTNLKNINDWKKTVVDFFVSTTNERPYILKLDNGLMIVIAKSSGTTSSNGSLTFTYAESFVDIPVIITQTLWNQSPAWAGTIHDENNTTASLRCVDLKSGDIWANFRASFNYIAIGKWK